MYKIILILLSVFTSCSNQNSSALLEDIKKLGDDDTKSALCALDSISASVAYEDVYTRMKYELLQIRLNDKADILPTSDKKIKELVSYFTVNGNPEEIQEVYFYAGSVYRDLKDTPSSLNYFLKSKSAAEANSTCCDSIMLRNTYSNLCYLYDAVQDNSNFLTSAQKEYGIASQIDAITETCLVHIGDAYFANDSIQEALFFYNLVFDRLVEASFPDRDVLASILYNYSYLGQNEKAERCASLLQRITDYDFGKMADKEIMSLGEYYILQDDTESAIKCFEWLLDHTNDLLNKYDATRHLFNVNMEIGDKAKTIHYGDEFIKVSGALNLGKRQELAATVNNIYRYNKDKDEEQRLIMENHAYQTQYKITFLICIIAILSILFVIAIYRYRQLQKMIALNLKIENISKEKQSIENTLVEKENILAESKFQLDVLLNEIRITKRQLENTQEEAVNLSLELKNKESILKEKIEQNKTIISLMHQTEFEINAKEIIQTLKKSGDGERTLSEKGWRDLYAAVDKLWPDFKEQMCNNLGTVTDHQRQFCYLARAGFSNTQIQNMANLSRVTVWRWSKNNEWLFTLT